MSKDNKEAEKNSKGEVFAQLNQGGEVDKRRRKISREFSPESYLNNLRMRKVFSWICGGIFLPVLLIIFQVFWKGHHYYLVSLGIIAAILVPFSWIFQYRKLRAREIVVLANMITFTVGFNVISNHTFHGGTAMVILSGIALGPEAGFLVGALGRLVCNFFDGQGAWTPWEMVAWGVLGFLGGLAFNKMDLRQYSKLKDPLEWKEIAWKKSQALRLMMGPVVAIGFSWIIAYLVWLVFRRPGEGFWGYRLYVYGGAGIVVGTMLQRKKLPVEAITMAIFTFFTVFIVYGGIMNFSAFFLQDGMTGGRDTWIQTLKVLYLTGAPYDAIHAGFSAIIVFLIGEPLLAKLQRVQIKYGIYQR